MTTVDRSALLVAGSLLIGWMAPAAAARAPDPIPPQAVWMSDDRALALLPSTLRHRPGVQLVLHRGSRQLIVLDQGRLRLRVPAAVGTEGWETPTGEHQVLFKTANPVWRHPATGALVAPGGNNPLGSRWIAFHQDCSNRGAGMGKRWFR